MTGSGIDGVGRGRGRRHLERAQVDPAGLRARVPAEVRRARRGQERPRVDRGRALPPGEVVGRRVHEPGVGEGRVTVVPRPRTPSIEIVVADALPLPRARGAAVDGEVEVVIEDVADVLAVIVLDENVPCSCDDDVVRDHVVPRVELHEQLDTVGVHDRVVDDDAVLGAPPPVVAADRDPDRRRVVDQVVACRDVRGATGVFAGELDPDVHVVDRVALDQDVAAAVDVDAVGAPVVAVSGVAVAVDVPHLVAAHDPVARLVDGRIGRGALEADHVDPDVVRVVHPVVVDEEVLHVAVHHQGLGRAEGEVRELVADDLDLLDRVVSLRAEHADPVRVPAVAALERRPHVADDVVDEPDVVGGARHQDPDRDVVRRRRSDSR